MNKKVLIRGAGDLASGIAVRLHAAGYQVVMTDRAVPTTVRRTVAFSRAVYEGTAEVEGITGVLCMPDNVDSCLKDGNIAVLIDEDCCFLHSWKPVALVDAIIAKKNLGTKISDAPIVIGVGPGFTAGEDCDAAVETQRGHDLGRCFYIGSTAPDTGIPGEIGGYSIERILRVPCDGLFKGAVTIGTVVKAGDITGYVDNTPMYSQIDGVVRGLLQNNVAVFTGMKAGDIDPRCKVSNCFTVSDKARAIGGGVLEAILHLM